MYALIAAMIAIAVIAVMWRVLDNEVARREGGTPGDREVVPRPRPVRPRRTPKPKFTAPDDDPEFLRELGKRIGKKGDDEQPV